MCIWYSQGGTRSIDNHLLFAAKLLTPSSRSSAAELYAFARFVNDTMDLNATNAAAKTTYKYTARF